MVGSLYSDIIITNVLLILTV